VDIASRSATLVRQSIMLKIHSRRLPHWEIEGAYYYITFRLQSGKLSKSEIRLIVAHISSGHNIFYKLIALQIMPDHIHLIIQPIGDLEIPRIIKGIKGVTAMKINRLRSSKGKIWMQEYFDRIIRAQSDLDEKLSYMFFNPVKAGLVKNPEDYMGWYLQE
jgi:putative transposase